MTRKQDRRRPLGAGAEDFDWASLVARLLHPLQVAIIEAFQWLSVPLSAADITSMASNVVEVNIARHHLRQLVKLGVLREVGSAPSRRGAERRLYFLASRGYWTSGRGPGP